MRHAHNNDEMPWKRTKIFAGWRASRGAILLFLRRRRGH
jgi:hypothetical protein